MFRRSLRWLLVALGSVLLIAGGLPVFVFFNLGEPLQTALVASKLLMLPAGAVCLIGVAALQVQRR